MGDFNTVKSSKSIPTWVIAPCLIYRNIDHQKVSLFRNSLLVLQPLEFYNFLNFLIIVRVGSLGEPHCAIQYEIQYFILGELASCSTHWKNSIESREFCLRTWCQNRQIWYQANLSSCFAWPDYGRTIWNTWVLSNSHLFHLQIGSEALQGP